MREELKQLIMIRQERINEMVEATKAGLDVGNIELDYTLFQNTELKLEELFDVLEDKKQAHEIKLEREMLQREIEKLNQETKRKEA